MRKAVPAAMDVFISYAPADEALRSELEAHLAALTRNGALRCLHNRQVQPGDSRRAILDAYLEAARIIVLLVSSDYLASDECEAEMTRALARHRSGEATLIPVLIRDCHWSDAPFATLEPLPKNAAPVMSWGDRDKAWKDVVVGIRAAAAKANGRNAEPSGARQELKHSREEEALRLMSKQLEAAFARKRELTSRGLSAASVEQEILDLRRRLRQGGQLRAGDSLAEGRYLLEESVGRGGFGTVWRAHDRDRRERVAIKVLHSNIASDPIRRERFFRGARVMDELKHSAIVAIREPYGDDVGYSYFVMEFVPGKDLRRAVLDKQVRSSQMLPILLRVADGVELAHSRSIVHRDIKPGNILLDALSSPKLTDFDLVAAPETTGGTRTGALGTWIYAAPELMDRPQDAGAAADVYSLGMTAIFGLYGADLPQIIIRDPASIINKVPCKGAVKRVLSQAVEWAPGERFANAGAFVEALRRAMADTSSVPAATAQAATPPTPAPPIAVPPPVSPQAAPQPAPRRVRAPQAPSRSLSPRPSHSAEPDVGQGPSSQRLKATADVAGAPPSKEEAPAGADKKQRQIVAAPAIAVVTSACRALAFARRSALMASGHVDGSVSLWDMTAGRLITVFLTDANVKSVALNSTGALIAAGSRNGVIRVWDTSTRNEVATLAELGIVAFHPHDDRISISSFSNAIHILRAGGGASRRVLEGHTGQIMSLAFSPDGAMLASSSYDGSIRIWDTDGRSEPRVLSGHKVTLGRHGGIQGIRTVAFSPGSRLIASGSEDGTAWLWDARTGEQRRAFVTGMHTVKSVAFSPDGAWLAIGTRGSVSVRSVQGDEQRVSPGTADSIRAVAWSPGSMLLAIASDQGLDVWNVVTGEMRNLLRTQHHKSLTI
jgi:eukaryotic-like serine/threonine-protein kinase